MLHMAFRKINERTDDRNAGAAHPGFRMKGAELSLIKQRHQQGFDGVFPVMSESKLIDAVLHTGVGQYSPAHFGTESAGIFFLPVFKNNPADFSILHNIGNIKMTA